MNKQHLTTSMIILIVILGIAGFSACASMASAQQTSGMQAQVNTAVAATLIQQAVETKVAEQSVALRAEPALQATQPPTATASATPAPTQPPSPTTAPSASAAQPAAAAAAAQASGPTIIADQNTNCRLGPGTGYAVITWLLKGNESTVEGRDATKDWWYIVSPDDADERCWVWNGSTTVVGDTSMVPLRAAPAGASTQSSHSWCCGWSWYSSYGCGCDPCWCCGKPVKWNKGWICFPYCQPACDEHSWWTCNAYGYCTCKPTWTDPFKKSNCPPVTEVNYKNYCKNYPQCCGD